MVRVMNSGGLLCGGTVSCYSLLSCVCCHSVVGLGWRLCGRVASLWNGGDGLCAGWNGGGAVGCVVCGVLC